MNLNTYRCGCGRIETLPHAKARPGPCVHGTLGLRPIALRQPERGRTRELGVEAVLVHEDGAERAVSLRGWELETQPFLKADGSAHVAVRARKGSRVLGRLWPAQQEDYGISELARKIEARYRFDRGGKFFTALRQILHYIRLASGLAESGMRPWTEPVVLRPCRCTVKTSAVPYSAGYLATPLAPRTQHAICRWRTVVRGADQLRYAKAAQMYCEGIEHLGLRAYVLATKVWGGDVVRVAFDTEEMEDTWVDAANYRFDLVDRIQAATGVALCHLLDVPGKRPSWFPADV